MKNRIKACKAMFVSVTFLWSYGALAQSISLTERDDAEIPYFLVGYSCDLTRLAANAEGKRVLAFSEAPPIKELAITRAQRLDIDIDASNAFADAVHANSDLRRIKDKIDQFEDAGNVEAMKHWRDKYDAVARTIEYAEKQKIYRKYIDRLIELYRPVTYYHVYGSRRDTKYRSVEEMKAVAGNGCDQEYL